MSHFVVVGLGSIGRRHIRNLAAIDPAARLTVVRHRGGKDDELCRQLGATVVPTIGDIGEDAELAVLATPSSYHIDALPTLIETGWPLLVEKPIVTTYRDADLVLEALATAPAAIRAAGFNLRYLPSLKRVRQLARSGVLGTLVRATLIAGQWLPDWRPGVDYRTIYSADAAQGGGVELDLCHEFDLARWFFGDMSVEFARTGRYSTLELQASDVAVAMLVPRSKPAPLVTVALDYVARQRVRWYEIVGDQARVEWSLDGRVELAMSDGVRSLVENSADFDIDASYAAMISDVVHAVRSGDASTVQRLEDGITSTLLALKVRDQGGYS